MFCQFGFEWRFYLSCWKWCFCNFFKRNASLSFLLKVTLQSFCQEWRFSRFVKSDTSLSFLLKVVPLCQFGFEWRLSFCRSSKPCSSRRSNTESLPGRYSKVLYLGSTAFPCSWLWKQILCRFRISTTRVA